MNNKKLTFQWGQLLVLTCVHFTVDFFCGMIPTILPVIRSEFTLTLTAGVAFIAAIGLAANIMQVLTGHMRADKSLPCFIYFGLIMAASTCFLAALPRSAATFPMLLLLAIISGTGIAIIHPECLRAVHTLKRITPAMSTAVFISGGFVGYSSSGFISAAVVEHWSLSALYFFLLAPPIAILLVVLLKIRLEIEPKENNSNLADSQNNRFAFWPIWFMALPLTVSATLISSLLPTRLNEIGFNLTLGSIPTMLFGLGGAVGSFFWAHIGHRKGELRCSIIALWVSLPFFIAHLVLLKYVASMWLLFVAGGAGIAVYPLMVTLTRHCYGPNLGQRMGFMLGGTWGIACVVLIVLGPVADRFGTMPILICTPVGYLISAVIGIYTLRKHNAQKTTNGSSERKISC